MKYSLVVAIVASLYTGFAGPLDKAWIKGTTDKDPLTYGCGEKMIFTLTPMAVGELAAGEWFLAWDRSGDDGVVDSGRVAFDGRTPFTYETRIEKPGFVRVKAFVVDAKGNRFKKSYTGAPGDKEAMNRFERANKGVFFDGGAGAEIGKLRTVTPPADLAEYWRTFGERLEKIPLKADRVLVKEFKEGKVYAVSINCAGIRPVTGYLSVPAAAGKGAKFPCRLETHGYGGDVRWHLPPSGVRQNLITLNINAFGQLLPAFGGTEADRRALWWAVHDGKGTGHGFSVDQNQNRDEAFFNGMVLRVKRGLQYLKSLPEWNGTDLQAAGGSQGGLQTIWAAACGEGVTLAESSITWNCDMYTNGKLRKDPSLKLAADGWYITWTPALNYYDAAIVATLIPKTCKVVVPRAGLGDYCCPPTGLAKLWNNLSCPKEFHWMQGSEHGYQPPAYEGRDFVRSAE